MSTRTPRHSAAHPSVPPQLSSEFGPGETSGPLSPLEAARAMVDVDVIIVGAGIAGIAMAMELQRTGQTFVVLEKGDEIGGTWRDNRYPGVACDVPSHLYSFANEPNPYWSHTYASGDEIQDYLLSVVEKHDLRRHIMFDAWVAGARYEESNGHWEVTYRPQDSHSMTLTSRGLVLGVGLLHLPNVPMIEGLQHFAGEVIHTAAWPRETSMFGRRVGVIGTGASAVQCIPPLAQDATHLSVFQRTPSWVLPRHNTEYSEATIDRFRRHPGLMKAHRTSWRVKTDARSVAFDSHPKLLEMASKKALAHLHNQVKDPQLREKLTPTYTMGCKRVLTSDDYYPALVRQDVTLVTDEVIAATPDGLVTADGAFHQLDVIVLATGFDPAGSYRHLDIVGALGRSLADEWADGVRTYLGIALADFPNLFLLHGPNTALGHTSVIAMIEAQVGHVSALLAERDRRGAASIRVRPELVDAFTRQVQERSERSVWLTGGCHSWYLDADGVNRTVWPGSLRDYENRCSSSDVAIDYLFE